MNMNFTNRAFLLLYAIAINVCAAQTAPQTEITVSCEKSTKVLGRECRIRWGTAGHPAKIEVVKIGSQNDGEVETTNKVAVLEVSNIEATGSDVALSPDGKLLWVLLRRNDFKIGGHVYAIYPLALNNMRLEYSELRVNKGLSNGDAIERVSLNLSNILRNLMISDRYKKDFIAFDRGTHVSDIHLESPENSTVEVTGKLGEKYKFVGTIGLGNDNQIWTRGFRIVSANSLK